MSWLFVLLIFTVFADRKLVVLGNPEPQTPDTTEEPQTPDTTEEPQTPFPPEGSNCNSFSFSRVVCENDNLKFCGPNNKIIATPCNVNGRQGFCNCEKDDCVAERPVCPSDDVPCYFPDSKFPDNLNCHKFYYCNPESKRINLECPGLLIYNPTTQKCEDMNSAKCNKVVCPKPGNTLQLIPFPQAPEYYVLCYKGFGDVRKCPDLHYAIRNNKCQFDCKLAKKSGLFKDTNMNKCKQGIYYACRRAGTTYTTVQAKCPNGMTFNENLGLCSKDNNCS